MFSGWGGEGVSPVEIHFVLILSLLGTKLYNDANILPDKKYNSPIISNNKYHLDFSKVGFTPYS
jgi:hypothetical protein